MKVVIDYYKGPVTQDLDKILTDNGDLGDLEQMKDDIEQNRKLLISILDKLYRSNILNKHQAIDIINSVVQYRYKVIDIL